MRLGNNITYGVNTAEPVGVDGIFQWFRSLTPGQLPQHPDGRYGSPQFVGDANLNNVLRTAQQARGEVKGNRFQGKIFGELTPLQGLKITASYFADIFQQLSWNGSEPANLWNFRTNQVTQLQESNPRTLSNGFTKNERQVMDLYADYVKSFGKHNGHILLGYNQEYYKSSSCGEPGFCCHETLVLRATRNHRSYRKCQR